MSFLLGAAVFASVLTASPQSEKDLIEQLPEHHRKWLTEEVTYIISDVEKKAFLRLQSEEEREAFLDAFWRKRDDNPATPENEYKIEHYERLAYVNEFMGRDTFREGWQTDMGRYYILLGPPRTRQNFEPRDEVYPAELWFYNDAELKRFNLPPFFYLLFFRRHGTGEMELYNPIIDGPQTLLTRINTVGKDYRADAERAYNELMAVDPELAHASLSFRTDEGDVAQFSSPSFGTIALLDDIVEAPFVGLDTSYAERLDFERGAVESDYMFTYVPSRGMMSILPGPAEAAYLHWVIQLDAPNVAFVQDQDSGNFASVFIASMEVVPRDNPNKLVVQFRRESFIRLPPSEQARLHQPFSYTGMTPLVPGEYEVRIILRNRACPSREETDCIRGYTLLDGEVRVPEWPRDRAVLGDLVLGYERQLRNGEPVYRAYRFGNVQVHPNPEGVYAIGDDIIAAIEPVGAEDGSQMRFQLVSSGVQGEPQKVLDESVPVTGRGPVIQELSLLNVEPDHYQLHAILLDSVGTEVDRKTVVLDVSPRTRVVRPGIRGTAPQLPAETPGIVAMTLGEQYVALERPDEARALFEEAFRENPDLGPVREHLARFAMEDGDTARVIELLSPVYADVQDRFEVLALLGHAYFEQEEYVQAVDLLEKAIMLRRPQPTVLNMLANAQYRVGNLARATELLERSLSLDADQEGLKELLEELESERARQKR